MASALTRKVESHPAYLQLTRERRRLATVLTVLMLLVYYGFILLVAFAPAMLGERIGEGATTLGLPLGVGVILVAIALTGIYVWKANSRFDALTQALRKGVQS